MLNTMNMTNTRVDFTLVVILSVVFALVDYFVKDGLIAWLTGTNSRESQAVFVTVNTLIFLLLYRFLHRQVGNTEEHKPASNVKAEQRESGLDEQNKSLLLRDIAALQASLPILCGHIDSANQGTEQSALAIMEVLGRLNLASTNMLNELSKEGENVSVLQAEQSRQLHSNQHMLHEISDYLQVRAQETQKSSENIQEVLGQVNSLTSLTGLIRDIAKQTNLLSLNAAIEAARAGETGRGFAVVADEVRKLSQSTETVTAEIDKAIQDVSDTVKHRLAGIIEGNNTTEEISRIESISTGLKQTMDSFADTLSYLEHISTSSRESLHLIHQDIVDALGYMQFQDLSRQQLESVQSLLTKIVHHFAALAEHSGSSLQESELGPLSAVLEQHKQSYVMDKQRVVHTTASGNADTLDSRPTIELF